MVERRMRLLETVSGTGKVYKDNRWLADVRYSLTVEQEIIVIKSESDMEELPGLISTYGEIEVLKGERDLVVTNEGPYTLQLGSGRAWEFGIIPWDPKSGTYIAMDAGASPLESREGDDV